jgi:hypothetical protein
MLPDSSIFLKPPPCVRVRTEEAAESHWLGFSTVNRLSREHKSPNAASKESMERRKGWD